MVGAAQLHKGLEAGGGAGGGGGLFYVVQSLFLSTEPRIRGERALGRSLDRPSYITVT